MTSVRTGFPSGCSLTSAITANASRLGTRYA